MPPPHFTTQLRGRCSLEADGQLVMALDVRIVQERESGRFRVLQSGDFGVDTYETVEQARSAAAPFGEEITETAAVQVRWEWAAALGPSQGEVACFVCGVGTGKRLESAERYPETLCPVCMHEVVDEEGELLAFGNETVAGTGFVAARRGSGEPHPSQRCYVRGRACWAMEAYFGGVVVVPYERRPHQPPPTPAPLS